MQPNTLKSTTKIYGPIGKISQNKQVYLLQFGLLPINLTFYLIKVRSFSENKNATATLSILNKKIYQY